MKYRKNEIKYWYDDSFHIKYDNKEFDGVEYLWNNVENSCILIYKRTIDYNEIN